MRDAWLSRRIYAIQLQVTADVYLTYAGSVIKLNLTHKKWLIIWYENLYAKWVMGRLGARLLEDTLTGIQFNLTFWVWSGASRVRGLPQEQFCRQGFVLGKASEAGFGNEMYKILTAAGLSIMLNRSLIIGQTRHNVSSNLSRPTGFLIFFFFWM